MNSVTPEILADLASTGRLRAAINFGNPILASKDPVTQEPTGVSVDLSRRLAMILDGDLRVKKDVNELDPLFWRCVLGKNYFSASYRADPSAAVQPVSDWT